MIIIQLPVRSCTRSMYVLYYSRRSYQVLNDLATCTCTKFKVIPRYSCISMRPDVPVRVPNSCTRWVIWEWLGNGTGLGRTCGRSGSFAPFVFYMCHTVFEQKYPDFIEFFGLSKNAIKDTTRWPMSVLFVGVTLFP